MDHAEGEGPRATPLRDLRQGVEPVAILARIVRAERRTVLCRHDGSERPILSGWLTDGTATLRFTWWEPPSERIEAGDVIRAAPVRVRQYLGRTELAFGWKTRVQPASAMELPEPRPEELPRRALAELAPCEEGFHVEVRVLEVALRTVSVGTGRREIHEGIVADASGALEFTAWSDLRLQAGASVRITGASVRSFRGRTRLALDERTRIDRIEGDTLPAGGFGDPVPLGSFDRTGEQRVRVAVLGRAVALRPPSGLVQRCPECRRILTGSACRTHGPVQGLPDLKLRLVLDDGTGTLTVELDRAASERLTGGTLDALRRHPDPAAFVTAWFQPLFGRRFRARGPIVCDRFGPSMFPREFEPTGETLSAVPSASPAPSPEPKS
ncbi:MAG: hypothetical protein ACYDFT_01435 [Thermoplasmata archaeon]